jgi:hypothetical protein
MSSARLVPVPGLNNRIGMFAGDNRPLAGARSYRAARRIEALFAFEHIPRFRAGKQVRPRARDAVKCSVADCRSEPELQRQLHHPWIPGRGDRAERCRAGDGVGRHQMRSVRDVEDLGA